MNVEASPLLGLAVNVVLAMLSVGLLLALGRLVRGPSLPDRVVALELTATLVVGVIVVYDVATTSEPVLSGVDNVTVTPGGDVFVAEDGGDMQICFLSNYGVNAFVQVTGVSGSEITGPAFDPSGTRLYFSSQRNPGTTYEVTGPFRSA